MGQVWIDCVLCTHSTTKHFEFATALIFASDRLVIDVATSAHLRGSVVFRAVCHVLNDG